MPAALRRAGVRQLRASGGHGAVGLRRGGTYRHGGDRSWTAHAGAPLIPRATDRADAADRAGAANLLYRARGRLPGGRRHPAVPAAYPPEIHRFVHAAAPAEILALTREPDFLRVLAAAPQAPVEDLLGRGQHAQ